MSDVEQLPYRALIVDDDVTVRHLTVRAMVAAGFTCAQAADGAEAIGVFDDGQYDLVVTDLRMPNRNGHSLAVDLLKREHPPHVIVLTGVTEPRLVKDLVLRGVDDVLVKPVDYTMLGVKARAFLDRAKELQNRSRETRSTNGTNGSTTRIRRDRTAAAPQDLAGIEQALIQSLTTIPSTILSRIMDLPTNSLSPPSADIVAFIKRLSAVSPYATSSRRKQPRLRAVFNAVGVPLDEKFMPSAEPIPFTVRDISIDGIGLIHDAPIDAKYLAIGWNSVAGGGIRVVAELLRCRAYGECYEIGAVFVKDFCLAEEETEEVLQAL